MPVTVIATEANAGSLEVEPRLGQDLVLASDTGIGGDLGDVAASTAHGGSVRSVICHSACTSTRGTPLTMPRYFTRRRQATRWEGDTIQDRRLQRWHPVVGEHNLVQIQTKAVGHHEDAVTEDTCP